MSNKPILFYSPSSTECVELWKYLKLNNRLDDFYKISIDNNNNIPTVVKSIPSIYIKGRPIIEGASVKLFIDSFSGSNARVQSTKTGPPDFKKSINNNSNSNNFDKPPDIESSTNNLEGIADFNAVEMDGGYSDKYSFISDNPPPMDNCYQFIDSMKDNSITGQQVQSNNINNNNSEFERRLENLQRERNF